MITLVTVKGLKTNLSFKCNNYIMYQNSLKRKKEFYISIINNYIRDEEIICFLLYRYFRHFFFFLSKGRHKPEE